MNEENIEIGSGDKAVGDVVSVSGEDFDDEAKCATVTEGDTHMILKYPADSYSFMAVHSPFDKGGSLYFAFGFMVWLFQVRDDGQEQKMTVLYFAVNSTDTNKK